MSRMESFSPTNTIKSSTPSVNRTASSRRAGGGGGGLYVVSMLSALRLPLAFSLSGSIMRGGDRIDLLTHWLGVATWCQTTIGSWVVERVVAQAPPEHIALMMVWCLLLSWIRPQGTVSFPTTKRKRCKAYKVSNLIDIDLLRRAPHRLKKSIWPIDVTQPRELDHHLCLALHLWARRRFQGHLTYPRIHLATWLFLQALFPRLRLVSCHRSHR